MQKMALPGADEPRPLMNISLTDAPNVYQFTSKHLSYKGYPTGITHMSDFCAVNRVGVFNETIAC
ncbi:MAG: hypothetical protein CMF67_13970 [Magnetovibrio sp.]|nr:hypothetical protein [Magnetovibrio sp.]